jgi:polyisoprenoid-binding protein YceI
LIYRAALSAQVGLFINKTHMHKLIILLSILSITAFSQNRFELSPTESKVLWRGENFGGAGGHEGTLQASSGYLLLANGQILKGEFELDMNSIRNTDQKDERGRKDLEEHLRSADFFETEKYPKAFFTITKIEPIPIKVPYKAERYTVTGFLGIKGITNSISFPAVLTFSNQSARAQATVTLDRTKWNVTYQSKTIFSSLKEGILSDDVKISIDFVFKEK